MPQLTDGHLFIAFRLDPAVCDSCGQLWESHSVASRTVPERTKSLWRTLIRLGGPYSFYGAGMASGTKLSEFREHMATCEPDWQRVREPSMRSLSYFAGTFTDGDYRTDILGGELTCRCGRYVRDEIVTPEMTLGQLIWHAVREGEIVE